MFIRITFGTITFAIAFLMLIMAFNAMASTGSAATTDTIVNVEAHANPYGDQFVVVAPAGWAQPVYGIWVTGACAATLSVGDGWPAVSPLCQ